MSRQSIAIIDYGMGNLHSVASAVKHVAPDAHVTITCDHMEVSQADKVIFPGVGAIRDCMGEIRRLHFDTAVNQAIKSGQPVLAICVGMQALMDHSQENNGVSCLEEIAGDVQSFADCVDKTEFKVPHMGWNEVEQVQEHPLWHAIENNARFYFVHSYFVALADKALQCGKTQYGVEFTSVLANKNLFATQFHPEKSHTNGLQLIKNFIGWDGQC